MKLTLTRTWTCSMDIEFSSHCSQELEAQVLNEIREANDELELWKVLAKYLVDDGKHDFNVFKSLGNVKGGTNSKLDIEGDLK